MRRDARAAQAAAELPPLPEHLLVQATGLELLYMPSTPFETLALRGVDLDIRRGEVLGLIGATGSGKSSFLQAVAGLVDVKPGHLRYQQGFDTGRLCARIGMVFQMPEDQLCERFVIDDVLFGPKHLGMPLERARAAAEKALARVGLEPRVFGGRETVQLSGGEKRRVALAGVLSMEPALLLLDEPTAGLDAPGQALLAKLVRDLSREGTTIVMVTHDLELLVGLATRVGVFQGGRVVTAGPTAQVLADVEALHAAGLNAPFAAELSAALALKGWPIERSLKLDPVLAALTKKRPQK